MRAHVPAILSVRSVLPHWIAGLGVLALPLPHCWAWSSSSQFRPTPWRRQPAMSRMAFTIHPCSVPKTGLQRGPVPRQFKRSRDGDPGRIPLARRRNADD